MAPYSDGAQVMPRKLPMRRLVVLVIATSLASPSGAAKRVTVAQLEQALAAAQAAHKSDANLAHEIGGFELSERLSDATLDRLIGSLSSGSGSAGSSNAGSGNAKSQAALALQLLADQSAFLDPPASDIPSTAAPDEATQQRMIASSRKYVAQTLLQLPNLFATRTTIRFDDSPYEVKKGGWPVPAGLHLVNTSNQESSILRERSAPSTNASWANQQEGLSSGGEFGSTLSMILSDTANGSITWKHWEQSPTGTLAVFHYSVPSSASHFEVINTVPRRGATEVAAAPTAGRHTGSMNVRSTGGPITATVITRPGYQGSLWIEPTTGTVVRTTIEADTKGSTQFKRAAIMVEYGPVQIGDSRFICPVRSLALSVAASEPRLDPITRLPGNESTQWLNESLFTGYHRFGSTARMVENASAIPPAQSAAPQPNPMPEATPPSNQEGAKSVEAVPAESKPASVAEAPAPPAEVAASTPPPLPEVAPVPAPTAPAQNSQDSPFRFVTNVNRAIVPVVVRDKQGRVVADLKKEDFQVFDRGKPQTITDFIIEKREVAASVAGSAGEGVATTIGQTADLPQRITLFLFDDLHLLPNDLAYLKTISARALEGALTGSDMAAVASTSGKVNSGITRDRVALQAAIMSMVPRSIYTSSSGDCPNIEYYQADLIEDKHDSTAFANALAQVFACDPALDRQRDIEIAQGMVESAAKRSVMIGEQDAQVTLATIKEYVRRMGKLPGQRTLVLVSPGFLSISQTALGWESQIMDVAAQSNVTINALDARGLYVGVTDIGERGGGQIIDPIKSASMSRAGSVMSELAYGTGGTFFHNNNDLIAGFKSVTEGPEVMYVLELSLDGVKQDGAYHRVNVKVDREGLRVQARQGYSAPKQEKDKK